MDVYSSRYKLHWRTPEVLIPLSDMLSEDYCASRLYVAVPPGDRCYDKFLLRYYTAQKFIV